MEEAKNEVVAVVARAVLPEVGGSRAALNAAAVEVPMDVTLNEFVGVVPLKNVGFLGRCFDFRRIDPLDLSLRARDGGGCMPTFAIDIPPDKCNVPSPDRSVLIPQGTTYRSESRGKRASRAQVWNSTADLTDSFKESLTVGLAIPEVFAFSASTSYEDIHKSTNVKKQTVTYVEGTFEFCSVELRDDFDASSDPTKRLELEPNFVTAVENLKVEGDCAAFIQKFGTHYARELVFGGRMYQRIHVSQTVKKELEASKKDLQAAAEGTYRKATLSVGGGTSSSDSSALESKQGLTVEDIRWVGGTPNTDFDEWVKSVREDPKPMQMDLEPLHNLFTEKRFPGINIALKKQWMEKAVWNYIEGVRGDTDLRHLNGKEYYIKNQWRADANDVRVNWELGYLVGPLAFIIPPVQVFRWRLDLVPGTADEFNIQVGKDLSAQDTVLGFDRETYELTVAEKKKVFPWKLVPVPGKADQYYLRCGSDTEEEEFRGNGVGLVDETTDPNGQILEKIKLQLVDPEDGDVVTPWLLVLVNP